MRGNYTVISRLGGRKSLAARRRGCRAVLAAAERRSSGTAEVAGAALERTRLGADGRLTGTGEFERIPVQMVLRSVGYQSVPLPGVPFDERSAVVPNAEGRVTGPDGKPLPGEYVAGWLKRGPTGVIGTNKSDAAQTVRALLADLAGGPGPDNAPLPRAGLLRLPADARDGAGGPGRSAALLASAGARPRQLRGLAADRDRREGPRPPRSAAAPGSSWPAVPTSTPSAASASPDPATHKTRSS